MARSTEMLLAAEISVEDGQLVEILQRNIPKITQLEVFEILSSMPENLSSIKDDDERNAHAQRHEVSCPDYVSHKSSALKRLIKANWDKESNDEKVKNEELIMTMLKVIPRIDNDMILSLLLLRPNNVACIEDDDLRAKMCRRHGISSIPKFAGGKGGLYQRLREHIRNGRYKQRNIMLKMESAELSEVEVVLFGEAEGPGIERLTLGGDWAPLNRLFGENTIPEDAPEGTLAVAGIPLGMVSIAGGEQGVGKTRLLTAICGHISGPVSPHNVKDAPGLGHAVIYFQNEFSIKQFEEKNDSVVPQGANFVCSNAQTLASQFNVIEQTIAKYKEKGIRVVMVVVDSINMLVECANSTGAKAAIPKYKRFAEKHMFHLSLIGHLNGQKEIKGGSTVPHLVDQVFIVKHLTTAGQFSISCPRKNRAGATGRSVALQHTPYGVEIMDIGDAKKSRGNRRGWSGSRFGLDALGSPIETMERVHQGSSDD